MARYPILQTPERPRGTEQEQINRLYNQLFRLVEDVNNMINILNKEDKEDGK